MTDTKFKEDQEAPVVKEGKPMIKTLNKVGNSLALILDKSLLDLHQVDRDTPIAILSDGRNIMLSPQRRFSGKKVRASKFTAVRKPIK